MDRTIRRLTPTELGGEPATRSFLDQYDWKPEQVLAYTALADGPYGRFGLITMFFGPPGWAEPVVMCLDGPRGSDASEHRIGEHQLCLYYHADPPERRWMPRHDLLRLVDLARQHLLCEHLYRLDGTWPIDEAPHGAGATPAPSEPQRALPPPRPPGRNDRCLCGSGRKAKRCCFR
jgi:hypothetical protein